MHTEQEQAEVEAIAKAVGFAISHWGTLEGIVCGIYAMSMLSPRYATARDSFYSIVSFQAKLKMVDACFRSTFRHEVDLLAEWKEFKKAAEKVSIKRNELAHGTVQIVYTEPKTIGWFPFWNGSQLERARWDGKKVVWGPDGSVRIYNSREIAEISRSFFATYEIGNSLYQKAGARLQASGKVWNHWND